MSKDFQNILLFFQGRKIIVFGMSTRILIVGGGPAGASCAMVLAEKGFEIFLFEKEGLGRDKICGDALLSDTQKNLFKLGIHQEIQRKSMMVSKILLYGPRGKAVDVPFSFWTLQRAEFNQDLRESAERRGTRVFYDCEITRIELTSRGVGLHNHQKETFEGDMLVLATGSNLHLPNIAGFTSEKAYGVGLRAYIQSPRELREAYAWFDKDLSPGYAWIFPVPGNVLNVGIGGPIFNGSHQEHFQEKFKRFIRDKVIDIIGEVEWLSPLHGFPLRAGLRRARVFADRVLLVGEAASSTYDFTGDGIGPAMTTGILAAELLAKAGGDFGEKSLAPYQEILQTKMAKRYRSYAKAANFYQSRLGYFLFSKALEYSSKIGNDIACILQEKKDPEQLFSLKGFAKRLFQNFLNNGSAEERFRD